MIQYIIMLYIIIINLVGFFIMGMDKRKAKMHQWRIKEKTLFLIAIIGGSVGSMLGMRLFHHKTKHKIFVYGMPAILILQIILLYFVPLF